MHAVLVPALEAQCAAPEPPASLMSLLEPLRLLLLLKRNSEAERAASSVLRGFESAGDVPC